jgi:acyl-CoA synthetase (AMP-forming)/AMP-acid ligase II
MNIALRLVQIAKVIPENIAVTFPRFDKFKNKYHYQNLTFRELDILSNKFAIQLKEMGIEKNDKVLLFLRPSLEFHAMTFAIFKAGIIPVFIDPGMGKKNLLKCIKDIKPVALIAEKEVHLLSLLFPKVFQSIKYRVSPHPLLFPFKNKLNMEKMKKHKIHYFKTEEVIPSDLAAILYTSGGTGIPKGVIYTHEIFNEQTEILKDLFHLTTEDIDLPGFPLFSLFTISMGMKSVIPDMDPSRPSEVDPEKIYQNIIDQSPTFIAGSPAIWERLADFCLSHKRTLPSVKYVAMFGAPVSVKLHKKFKNILPNGTTYTPYGATECLPVSNISGEYILKNTAKLSEEGIGTCIGKPIPTNEVRIIKYVDKEISKIDEVTFQAPFIPGEIIVKGKVATPSYFEMETKTKEAKIYDHDSFWHRMGDIGFLDEDNKLWFLGRCSHQVFANNETEIKTYFPIPVEAIFNRHVDVKRSALISVFKNGHTYPGIVIERKDGEFLRGKDRAIFESELLKMAKQFPHTKEINKIYFSNKFPVDVRHNIKIDRTKLQNEMAKYDE